MKVTLSAFLAAVGWFAVITQYVLMIENRVTPVVETSIRFLSFFTILTNSLVALYFTSILFQKGKLIHYASKPGVLTAITTYITIVGLVYQLVLRGIWEPKGLQKVVDELLHSFIPLAVVLFWVLYERKNEVPYAMIPKWLLYPFLYLLYVLSRGHFSGFYPYPFVNVSELGMQKVLFNSLLLLVVFVLVSALFVFMGKTITVKQKEPTY